MKILLGLLAVSCPEFLKGAESRGFGGWGVDACLTAHLSAEDRPAYIKLLRQADVRIVRERGPNDGLAQLEDAGLGVVAFAYLPGIKPTQPGNALPENLVEVFEAARKMGRDYAEVVDAWEILGEPDVGFCPDLPDRAVAFHKAVYLGLKRGAAEGRADRVPLVLMGGLALPPGPWLQRALRNDLLDYTDAYNFHFYGYAGDLAGVIKAHARVAHRIEGTTLGTSAYKLPTVWRMRPREIDLPLWITECGFAAMGPGNFFDPARRVMQAEFALETAQAALAAPRVSVFMPFVLTHEGDPYAMTKAGAQVLPAWEAYARFTQEHAWPKRPVGRAKASPPAVVVQWLPDNTTTATHKVSGTYRWLETSPMRGEIRFYNFSDQTVRGRWKAKWPEGLKVSYSEEINITIEPGEMKRLPVELAQPPPGYFQAWVEGEFQPEEGQSSRVCFGLERTPSEKDFREKDIRFRPLPPGGSVNLMHLVSRSGSSNGIWQTINGVQMRRNLPRGGEFEVEGASDFLSGDPLRPTTAAVGVEGLPSDGFIILRLDRPMSAGHAVRLDLIDDSGQRFTIWENFGQSYSRNPDREIWLNVRDFNLHFWGRCSEQPSLKLENVHEIQLRFYAKTSGDRFGVELFTGEKKQAVMPPL